MKETYPEYFHTNSDKPLQVIDVVLKEVQQLIKQREIDQQELESLRRSQNSAVENLSKVIKKNTPEDSQDEEGSFTSMLEEVLSLVKTQSQRLQNEGREKEALKDVYRQLEPLKDDLVKFQNKNQEIDIGSLLTFLLTEQEKRQHLTDQILETGDQFTKGDTNQDLEEIVISILSKASQILHKYREIEDEIESELSSNEALADLSNSVKDENQAVDLLKLVRNLLDVYQESQTVELEVKKISTNHQQEYQSTDVLGQLRQLDTLLKELSNKPNPDPNPSSLIDNEVLAKARKEIEEFSKVLSEDQGRAKKAKAEFTRWKGYITKLMDNYKNELIYKLSQVFKDSKYHISDSNRVFLLGLEARDEKNIGRIEDLQRVLNNINSDEKLADALQASSHTNIRGQYDIDFLFQPEDVTLSKDAILYVKQRLTSLLLWYKILLKEREKLLKLAASTVREERVFKPLKDMSEKINQRVSQVMLSGPQPSSSLPEMQLNQIFDQADDWLKENFRSSNEMRDTAESLRKGYVKFLTSGVFRVGGEILIHRKNALTSLSKFKPEEQDYIKSWLQIFQDFYDVIVDFLRNFLHIIPLQVERGQHYHYLLHQPVDHAEPDAEYKDDDIKEVFNDGFRLMHPDSKADAEVAEIMTTEKMLQAAPEAILHQAGVVLVKN